MTLARRAEPAEARARPRIGLAPGPPGEHPLAAQPLGENDETSASTHVCSGGIPCSARERANVSALRQSGVLRQRRVQPAPRRHHALQQRDDPPRPRKSIVLLEWPPKSPPPKNYIF